MILVGVGYTVSSVFAVNNLTNKNTDTSSQTHQSSFVDATSKEPSSASVEQKLAEQAISLRNGIVEFVQNGSFPSSSETNVWPIESNSSNQTSSNDETESVAVISLAEARPYPLVYNDIANSPAKEAILNLYSNDLIQKAENFNLNNYVRISDFVRVVMDTYRLQLWYSPKNLEGLSEKKYFSYTTVPQEIVIRINSAYELWFLQKLALEDTDWNPRIWAFITPTEAQDILSLIEKKSPTLVQSPKNLTFESDQTLRKEEMAQMLVEAFALEINEHALPVFTDISWTSYQDAIQMLARRWIVAWVNGKFYPNANVENKDFVIMLTRSLLAKEGSPVALDSFYYIKPLQNVSTTSTFAPYLEYCLRYEMCDTLLDEESSGVAFSPNRLLSWGQVTSILSALTTVKFSTPDTGNQYLTRGELAYLLVNVFALDEKQESESNTLALDSLISKEQANSLRDAFKQLMKIS